MKIAVLSILINTCVCAASTTALFNSTGPDVTPFPSNALTVTDTTQQTGLHVNLPASFSGCDPASSPSVCADPTTFALINQLDGFSINPRVMACFSGPIEPSTLPAGMQIVPVGGGSAVGINQVIFDPVSNCAFAKPNQVLNQQSRYVLIVTNSIRDSGGKKVQQAPEFAACLAGSDPYCESLETALSQAHVHTNKLVAASLFTTMSATNWMEQARRFVDANSKPLQNKLLASFNLSSVGSMTWVPQGSGDDAANSETITPSLLSGVGQVAFGMFQTPLFLDPTSGAILPTPTGQPISAPAAYIPVSYHVFLPSTPALSGGGYPVAIFGHGLGDNQFGASSYIASTLAQFGIATLSFEIVGHGYGPRGVVNVTTTNDQVQTVPTPGRGIQLSPNAPIGQSDGCILPGALAVRDCGRQTAVDLSAMVATIRATNGLGLGLNRSQIYYVGESFGSTYGTLFHAVEPNENTAVLNGAGGTSVDVARLAVTGRPLAIEYLGSINATLLNAAGGTNFNDNYVFRDLPPVTNNVPGAMAIQAAFEAADWLGMVGDPLSFAPHLKTAPLAGVPPKSTLFQFGYGDLEVPNPTESAVVRAANAQSSTWFFRFDKAVSIDPNLLGITMPAVAPLPILPHRLLSNPTVFQYPDETPLSIADQSQAGAYFFSGGLIALDPDLFLGGSEYAGANLFQEPSTLPTQPNFLIPVNP
jgi:hypothetical protein